MFLIFFFRVLSWTQYYAKEKPPKNKEKKTKIFVNLKNPSSKKKRNETEKNLKFKWLRLFWHKKTRTNFENACKMHTFWNQFFSCYAMFWMNAIELFWSKSIIQDWLFTSVELKYKRQEKKTWKKLYLHTNKLKTYWHYTFYNYSI